MATNKKPAAKAPAKAPAAVPEYIKHVVTQEDLDNNPNLVEDGIAVGDEIDVANPDYVKPAAKGKFPEALVATIKEHKHINCAWVSENGEWHFAEKPGFTAYSREDIING